jgi:hypothetical protein
MSNPATNGGKSNFNPGFEEAQLMGLIRSPAMKAMTSDSSAGDKIPAHIGGAPSANRIREWIAICICRFFREFEIDPGIAVRRIAQAPGFKIKYDIEMDTAISGAITKYRIVVEEMPDDAMMISIVKNDGGSTETIIRHDFGNMGDVVWSKVAAFDRRNDFASDVSHFGGRFDKDGRMFIRR